MRAKDGQTPDQRWQLHPEGRRLVRRSLLLFFQQERREGRAERVDEVGEHGDDEHDHDEGGVDGAGGCEAGRTVGIVRTVDAVEDLTHEAARFGDRHVELGGDAGVDEVHQPAAWR